MTRRDWVALTPYFLALVLALLLGAVVHADDRNSGPDIDIDTPVDVTSTTNLTSSPETNVTGSTYSSRALAIGNGLGDVDINDCLGSEQFGTPLYSRQWLELNKWCAAEVFDAKGLNIMAGKLRCEIKEIAKLFDDPAACLDANTIHAPPAATVAEIEPVVATLSSRIDEHDDEEERHEEQIEQTVIDLANLKQSIDNERAARRRYAAGQREQADQEVAERNAFLEQYKELTQQTEEPPRE